MQAVRVLHVLRINKTVYPQVSGLAAWSENCKWHSSVTRCSCIATLWVSLVSFVAITLCVVSQRVFIFVFVISLTTQSGNFWILPCTRRYSSLSRCSSVSTVTRLRAGRPDFDSLQGQWFFLFVTAPKLALLTNRLPIQWVMGALSPKVKRKDCAYDN
jgi:hypothetical protein